MSTKIPRHDADGSARRGADPSGARRDHLRAVGSVSRHPPDGAPADADLDDTDLDDADPDDAGPGDARRDETFRLVQQHLQLASRLGVGPLTVTERARSMLGAACVGWRRNGQCDDGDAQPRTAPHEACLLAQYHHDLLLLEHGLLGPAPDRPEAVAELVCSSPPRPQRKRSTS